MEMVNMHEAKTHLSKLVQRAEAGEEIIIGRSGKPAAKLVPYVPNRQARTGGQLHGQIWISPDFDAPDQELESMFQDSPIGPEPDKSA